VNDFLVSLLQMNLFALINDGNENGNGNYGQIQNYLINNRLNDVKLELNRVDAKTMMTPLWRSLYLRCYDIAALLIEWGANPNCTHPAVNSSCLHWACERMDKDAIRILVNYGACKTTLNLYDQTPLETAMDAVLRYMRSYMLEDQDNREFQYQLIDDYNEIANIINL